MNEPVMEMEVWGFLGVVFQIITFVSGDRSFHTVQDQRECVGDYCIFTSFSCMVEEHCTVNVPHRQPSKHAVPLVVPQLARTVAVYDFDVFAQQQSSMSFSDAMQSCGRIMCRAGVPGATCLQDPATGGRTQCTPSHPRSSLFCFQATGGFLGLVEPVDCRDRPLY